MKQSVMQVHKSWLIPMTLVLVITCLVDCVVVWYAQRPFLWAVLIGATLPLSTFIFVTIPLLKLVDRES